MAFESFQIGYAATLVSIILLPTLLLGLVAGLLVILTRLRLVYKPNPIPSPSAGTAGSPRQNPTLPLIVLIATLLLVLRACFLSAFPFGWAMQNADYEQLREQAPFLYTDYGQLREQVLSLFVKNIYTVGPPLIAAIAQVSLAYLGALGIGAILPFGKHNEWLLLPFSPWLFITIVPLSLAKFKAAQEMRILNSFPGLIPPFLCVVPLLFILTLFFKGQASRWLANRSRFLAFFRYMILPSLPLTVVLLVVVFVIGLQGVFWPLIVTYIPEFQPMSVFLLRKFANDRGLLAAAVTRFTVAIAVLFFLVLVVFQLFYLDRLALRAGAERNDKG